MRLFEESTEKVANRANEIDEAFIADQCELLLKEAGVKEAPISPHILGSFRDIRKVEERDMSEAGMIFPAANGGLHVHLRRTDGQEKKNFTHFHEIAHTFFPDYKLKPQKRVDRTTGDYNRKDQTECLCDYGASRLLMPAFLFNPEFNRVGLSLDGLDYLHSHFGASLEATGLRMVSESPKDSGFIVWEKKFKPTELKTANQIPLFEQYKQEEKLRIKFGFGLERGGYMPADKSLSEDNGLIQEAFSKMKNINGIEVIDFGNFKVRLKVQVKWIGGANPRVLTLVKIVSNNT